MAYLDIELPADCDVQTFEEWSSLFPYLGMLVKRQLKLAKEKYPHKAESIGIRFAGDITGITSTDVENRTAGVTAISLMDGKQTLKGKIISFLDKLFQKKRDSLPNLKEMRPIIVCTVVIVPPEESADASNSD